VDRAEAERYLLHRMRSIATRNQKIAVARRILKLAAEVWCYHYTNITWLERTPTILLEKGHRARGPYTLDAAEQELLFNELPPEHRRIALFAVNTGLRDQELCRAVWSGPGKCAFQNWTPKP